MKTLDKARVLWRMVLTFAVGLLLLPASAAGFTGIPICQFGIFYNGILEFSAANTLTISTLVHCNTNIYVGSPAPLTFNGFVSCSGIITNPPMAGLPQSEWTGSVSYNGSPVPGWSTHAPVMTVPIGDTNSSANSALQILYPPVPGESITNPISPQRFYNKASLVLMISNNSVSVTVKSSMYDISPVTFQTTNWIEWTTNSFQTVQSNTTHGIVNWLTLFSVSPTTGITNFGTANWNANTASWSSNVALYDARQLAPNRIVQVDVGNLGYWIATNQICTNKWPGPLNFLGVLYVADWRTNTSSDPGWMDAIRLTNGSTIYTNVTIGNFTYPAMQRGLTVATPNPLYVWGDYDEPVVANRGTQNVANTAPTSFVCDAITVLSTNWSDALSFNGYACSHRNGAANTTVNAAIITGNIPSTGPTATTYSGGVPNLTRFLENWNGQTVTLNTSLDCLYPSAIATNQFVQPADAPSSDYYEPPTRHYYFNTNYLSLAGLPPGTPLVTPGVPSVTWANPAPITYGVALSSNQLNAAANTYGSFAYNPPTGTVTSAGTNMLSVVFTPGDTVDYSSVTDSVSLVTLAAPLTVAANDANRPYGIANPAFSGMITGLQNGDNITATFDSSATPGTPPGAYPIVPSLADPGNLLGNYAVTTNKGTLTVLSPPAVSGSFANDVFQVSVSAVGTTNQYVLEASTDLTNWTALITNTSPFTFGDSNAGSFPQRFYRVVPVGP